MCLLCSETVAHHIGNAVGIIAAYHIILNGMVECGNPLGMQFSCAAKPLQAHYLMLDARWPPGSIDRSNGGGAFVNMLSIVSFVGAPWMSTYSASKAAPCNYTNSARRAGQPRHLAGRRARRLP